MTTELQGTITTPPKSLFAEMANIYGMDRAAFESTIKKTIMPAGTNPTNEQIAAFLIVAKQYNLNPFTKEIYAFPAKNGGIVPIVPIDGWIKIINSHPQFNGMDIEEHFDDQGKISAVTCRMYRGDREHPVVITEYLSECVRDTSQWKDKPIRMLRHKAVIQAARYTFGFAGIMEPDEAERMIEMGAADVVPTVNATQRSLQRLRQTLDQRKEDEHDKQPGNEGGNQPEVTDDRRHVGVDPAVPDRGGGGVAGSGNLSDKNSVDR